MRGCWALWLVPLLVAQAGGAAAQVSGAVSGATALVGEVVECTSKKTRPYGVRHG